MRQNTTISERINKSIHRQIASEYIKASLSREISIETIQAITCKEFGISIEKMTSKTSNWDILIPRQVSMYFSRKFMPSKVILKIISNKHGQSKHNSAFTALKSIENLRATDKEKADKINNIENQLNKLV